MSFRTIDCDYDYLHIYEKNKEELIDFVLSRYGITPFHTYSVECDGKTYYAIAIPMRHKHIFDRDILR